MSTQTKKSTYQQPTLIEYGDLTEITNALSGAFVDGGAGGYQTNPG